MKFIIKILLLLPGFILAQNNHLESYIPFDTCKFSSHPILEIKVWVHVLQQSAETPKNITKDSSHFIEEQFQWINKIYSNLKPPSRKNSNNEKPYIKDSRIQFLVDTISYHIDSNGWERMEVAMEKDSNRWLEILEINADSNYITVKGVKNNFRPILDSLKILGTNSNNGILHTAYAKKEGRNTLIYFKETLNVSEGKVGVISYFKKVNKNCSKDNWVRFTNENKEFLHVFYTGSSSSVPAFGCGPSPFYLNVSKFLENGRYATAQLTAHELGHCIGLRHTNTPQFSDLPRKDKFGWINCNSNNVSNNIMGYNLCRNYLSPMQIGHVHYRYSRINELSLTTNNLISNNSKIVIKKNTHWHKNILSKGTVIIKKNKTLTVSKNLLIPKNGIIVLEKNSKIIVDGGRIYSPSKDWKGIMRKEGKAKTKNRHCIKKTSCQIILLNNGKISY
tara:strand:+ start:1413 stop:2756 length:1344 start_codon:yes stop_codon:yes gene_type:complete